MVSTEEYTLCLRKSVHL